MGIFWLFLYLQLSKTGYFNQYFKQLTVFISCRFYLFENVCDKHGRTDGHKKWQHQQRLSIFSYFQVIFYNFLNSGYLSVTTAMYSILITSKVTAEMKGDKSHAEECYLCGSASLWPGSVP